MKVVHKAENISVVNMDMINKPVNIHSLPINYTYEASYLSPQLTTSLLPMLLLSLLRQKHSPETKNKFKKEYDFIIVGAGSAGSVVANRLSEIPDISVLLLEAGPPPPLLTEIPVMGFLFRFSNIDWNYRTAPQKHTAAQLINRQVVWPSGKTLGGSSVLNTMLDVRGNKRNYDEWAKGGAKGWSYEEVLPYFKKLEDNRNWEHYNNRYHNIGGPVSVERPRYKPEILEPVIQAAKKLGIHFVDSNGPRQTGFYLHQATMRDGQRCSTAKAYLVPADNRTNLDIVPEAFVTKVLIQNSRAIGVRFDHEGDTYEVSAKREVILSAGTINTAQLLMLSGIGPKEELDKLNVPVAADLPVGKNLQDHCGTTVPFTVHSEILESTAKLVNPVNIAEYIAFRRGVYASSEMVSAINFHNPKENDEEDFPTSEIYIAELTTVFPVTYLGLKPEAHLQYYAPYTGRPLFVCVPQLVQPKSRGSVKLHSVDPHDPPNIDPNYLEDPRDLKDLVDGMKMCMKLGTSDEMKTIGTTPFTTSYPGCEDYPIDSNENFECIARSFIITFNHQVGTAKMGDPQDNTTVVDPQTRVKGIDCLRVVDASIMPTVPSGNTNIPTIMLAEKASDIIKDTMCSRR